MRTLLLLATLAAFAACQPQPRPQNPPLAPVVPATSTASALPPADSPYSQCSTPPCGAIETNAEPEEVQPLAPVNGDHITLERSACYGRCPAYGVRIFPDGRVDFRGQYWVCTRTAQATLTPEALKALNAAVAKANVWKLKDEYTSPITDSPTTLVEVVQNGKRKRIRDYPSCSGTPELCTLEKEIDLLAGTEAWIGKGCKNFSKLPTK
jgi:hypothetical protein